MIAIIVLLASFGSTAECVQSSRDEPTVWIKDNGESHFIHLLEGEDKKCKKLVDEFNANKLSRVCGCKKLVVQDTQDRLRLKCALVINQKVLSKTVATYYYYDDGISILACHRLSNILMNNDRSRRLKFGRRNFQ